MPDPRKQPAQRPALAAYAERLGLSVRSLSRRRVTELTTAERARLLKVRPELVATSLRLTPSDPRKGERWLEFHSPMFVDAGPVAWSGSQFVDTSTEGLALFSSKFGNGVVNPTVEVEFPLLQAGKAHLVEFYITTFSDIDYKFRLIQSPAFESTDLQFKSKKVVTQVVQPIDDFDGSYWVALMQLNSASELASWYFHQVVITAVG